MTFEIGQELYAPTRTKKVKVWSCSVEAQPDGSAKLILRNRTGIDAKEIVREEHITEGKNLGKANETTPVQQAQSEARSRYNKKIDKGYGVDIPSDTSKASDNAMGLPQPMLAQPVDKVRDFCFPAYWQPKLDGHRALVTMRDGQLIMYSRQGKPITSMGHILKWLHGRVQEGDVLDGELYIHGEALQNIGSLIKREQKGSTSVVYYVYDMMLEAPFVERIEILRATLDTREDLEHSSLAAPPVKPLESHLVADMDAAMKLTDRVVEQGYEGGILRVPSYMHGKSKWVDDTEYTAGFRSRHLLKIKSFDDAEFEVLGVIQGKPRNVNGVYLQVAIFQLQTAEGKPFEVLAPGTMYDKDRAWQQNHLYVGKQVTVKHMGLTKDGIPWHPVALRMREDI